MDVREWMAEQHRIEQSWRTRAEDYAAAMYGQAAAARLRGDLRAALEPMLTLCTHRTEEGMAAVARFVGDLAADGERGRTQEFAVRRMAWQLAQYAGTDFALYKALFFGEPPRRCDLATEFRACLLQELVRAMGLTVSEEAPGWWAPEAAYRAGLADLGHPLAWLPLHGFDFEHRLSGSEGTWGRTALVYGMPETRNPEVPPSLSGPAVGRTAREVSAPERERAVRALFTRYMGVDVHWYTLLRPLDPADFTGALLSALQAECLADNAPDTVRGVHTTGDWVLGDLYNFADGGDVWTVDGVNGAEWGFGSLGAYGRHDAWQALYALMGLDTRVALGQAVRNAADCRWLRFAVPQHNDVWFRGDGLDYGIAVLDARRTGLAVLAVTESQ